MAAALALAACAMWLFHADAWDLGRRSPVLSFDAAQYAVAARELAESGRLATPFALPIDVVRHAQPPWPLSLVQPGLVVAEAAVFRLVPEHASAGSRRLWRAHRPDQREWLVLIIPFVCFVSLALSLGLATAHLLAQGAPGTSDTARAAAGAVVGLAFVLDPEAQHFAVGGFTELPFTVGLTAAFAGLALGRAARFPIIFGLLLGVTGLFRGATLWLAPVLALGAAASAEPRDRGRVLGLSLGAWALVLAPWWIYKWSVFGDAGWDLSRWSLWDGVGGRTWFTLFHTADPPVFPTGAEAVRLLGLKLVRNLPRLTLMLANGLGAFWIGALAIALVTVRLSRAARVAGWTVLGVITVSLGVAALSVPLLRYLFPARVALEAAGLLASWALVARFVGPDPHARRVRLGIGLVAVLALAWGAWRTTQGLAEARAVAAERGTPSTETLMQITVLMNRELSRGEPVMSNLGPVLAWTARRPVVHLALTPDEVEPLRRHLDVRHVLLVFRDPAHAWPGWAEIVERPAEAEHRPEWNVRRMRRWQTSDGFSLTWLDLGPLAPGLASRVAP